MRVTSSDYIQAPSASSPTTRMLLAAKDNTKSSIDQKSEGCFSSLWNSFVSVLSSIWNFFTGCCKAKPKETSTQADPIEKVSFKLAPKRLKNELSEFASHANKKFDEKIQNNSHGSLKFKNEIYWIQINNEKHLISQIQFNENGVVNPISEALNAFNTDNLKLDDVSEFSMHALLMEWQSGKTPYQYTYVGSRASLKGSSEELKLSFTLTDETSETLTANDAKEYIATFFNENEEKHLIKDILERYIY